MEQVQQVDNVESNFDGFKFREDCLLLKICLLRNWRAIFSFFVNWRLVHNLEISAWKLFNTLLNEVSQAKALYFFDFSVNAFVW